MSNVATRLRDARRARGWTQEKLAEASGTSQAVVQKIENGKSLRPRCIEDVAKALGTSPEALMYGVPVDITVVLVDGKPEVATHDAAKAKRKAAGYKRRKGVKTVVVETIGIE